MARVGHVVGCRLVGMGIAEWKNTRRRDGGFLTKKYSYLFTRGMRHPPQNRYLIY